MPKKTRKPTRDQGQYFDSMTHAAAATNIPLHRLKSAKNKGCRAFRSGRVYLKPLLDWFTGKNEIAEKIYDWRTEKIKTQTLREKLRLSRDEKKTMEFKIVEFALARGMAVLFEKMDRAFSVELPPVLKGLDEQSIHAKLIAAVEDWKDAIRAEFGKLATDEPPAEIREES